MKAEKKKYLIKLKIFILISKIKTIKKED